MKITRAICVSRLGDDKLMTWVFYGHYENQFVFVQSELTYISFSLAIHSSLSSLRAPLKIVCCGWESNFASFLIN